MGRDRITSADDIGLAGALAAALEVSGWPKPGNVHRTADYPDTTFEQFVAGSLALVNPLREAASRARECQGKLDRIRIGLMILRAVESEAKWHNGGNTHLGTALLLAPLASAAGLLLAESRKLSAAGLRRAVKKIVRSTTVDDAVMFYRAARSINRSWLGRLVEAESPDILDSDSLRELRSSGSSLLDVMRASERWDNLAREWATGFKVTFEIGYPHIIKTHSETRNFNVIVVHTFLTILSRLPDTFIARKIGRRHATNIAEAVRLGMPEAKKVSEEASKILDLGGMLTPQGKETLDRLDTEMRRPGALLNPGSTADLTASSLMVALLTGLRP